MVSSLDTGRKRMGEVGLDARWGVPGGDAGPFCGCSVWRNRTGFPVSFLLPAWRRTGFAADWVRLRFRRWSVAEVLPPRRVGLAGEETPDGDWSWHRLHYDGSAMPGRPNCLLDVALVGAMFLSCEPGGGGRVCLAVAELWTGGLGVEGRTWLGGDVGTVEGWGCLGGMRGAKARGTRPWRTGLATSIPI